MLTKGRPEPLILNLQILMQSDAIQLLCRGLSLQTIYARFHKTILAKYLKCGNILLGSGSHGETKP